MEKGDFSALLSDICIKYSCYADAESGELRKVFNGMSEILEKRIINYSHHDFSRAAHDFIEKSKLEGHDYPISYGTKDFLSDPDTRKKNRTIIDFLYDTYDETITAETVSRQTLSSLADISLQYIWEVTSEGARGVNYELVIYENDVTNIKLFCEIINYFKPDYAEIILSKAAELLDIDAPGRGMTYAIKLRNYFIYPDHYDIQDTSMLIFGRDILHERNDKLQEGITSEKLGSYLGNIRDGDRAGSGILGWIEDNYRTKDHIGFQGDLHSHMDDIFFGEQI